MLGRLLSTAASTLNPAAYGSRNTTQLESVTEEEHTSGLLFPDASLLRHSNFNAYPLQATFNSPNASSAGAYDDRGGLELDPIKDFRVIVAQNALGDRDACVLLDTRSSSSDPARGAGRGVDRQPSEPPGIRHARTVSSLSRGSRRGHAPGLYSSATEHGPFSNKADARKPSPASQGAFLRARGRSSTLSPTAGDPYHPRHPADSNDSGLLNCIFGSSAFSYRGSSTKMHIISTDDEPEKAATVSTVPRDSDPRGASGRNQLSRAQSTESSSGLQNPNPPPNKKPPAKVTVLLTRMFSVNLPEAGDALPETRRDSASSAYRESLSSETSFPFHDAMRTKKIKEKKTPMYAVAITVQIPLLSRTAGRPPSRLSTHGPDSPRLPMSCSLDSGQGWRNGFLDDSMSLASPPASLDERIDLFMDHWDVITRTLSHLERLARKEILFLLKRMDALSGPHPKPAKAPNMQRTNQTIVHLPANILSVNSNLRDEALQATRRINRALQTPYVVTGQSRWGVWREEGRSIIRNLGDKEHGFFFLVLVTAFLGNHTEWLDFLAPDWYRRRHHLQQRAQQDSDPLLSQRTVIISSDKMTARRLIFLLAAFLPAKQRLEPLASSVRPEATASMRTVSQSPPDVPILRHDKHRKIMERRSRPQRSNMGESEDRRRSLSFSSNDAPHRWTDDVELNGPADFWSSRRDSDTRSVKTLNVPMPLTDVRSRKASAAPTSTATPSNTVPVPHFASGQGRLARDGPDNPVADDNESLASETLLKSLQRSESSTLSTNGSIPSAAGRLGGFWSAFWGSRQRSSTGRTDATPPPTYKRSVSALADSHNKGDQTTLDRMVRDVSSPSREDCDLDRERNDHDNGISIPSTSTEQQAVESDLQQYSPATDRAKESPLKLSVRAEDGVVDVDLPLPGFTSLPSSDNSAAASPKKTHASAASVDAMASTTHSSGSAGHHFSQREHDAPNVNVSGWLKRFHEDFLLQAVRPYDCVEADIKRAMQAEPTPPVPFPPDADETERWVDVATTLVADTRTSTVKRLRLKRKVILGSGPKQSPVTPPLVAHPCRPMTSRRVSSASTTTQFSGFFSHVAGSGKYPPTAFMDGFRANEAEETFFEEPVMDLDGTLVDAVERVLEQSRHSSVVHSRVPSPSRNRRGGEERSTSEPVSRDEMTYPEVPRGECRKTVLGALEEVVRSVLAEHCREDVTGEFDGIADRERRRSLAGADNTLREGVRRWLINIEEAW